MPQCVSVFCIFLLSFCWYMIPNFWWCISDLAHANHRTCRITFLKVLKTFLNVYNSVCATVELFSLFVRGNFLFSVLISFPLHQKWTIEWTREIFGLCQSTDWRVSSKTINHYSAILSKHSHPYNTLRSWIKKENNSLALTDFYNSILYYILLNFTFNLNFFIWKQ